MRGRQSHQGIEKGIAGEQIRAQSPPLHQEKDFRRQLGLPGLNVSSDRGVEERLRRGIGDGTQEGVVESVAAVIGGDEGDEERLGVGEPVAAEDRGEECEKEGWGLGERGLVGLNPFEESDKL